MKNSRLVYGFNPQTMRKKPQGASPITLRELELLGIPESKRERVLLEVTRLAELDPALAEHPAVFDLAQKIAETLR